MRRALWWVLPTLAVAVLGAVHVPRPFTGDQALYALAGQLVLDGGAMHRDLWDIKHPGVHHAYALAQAVGAPFAESAEARVHLVELGLWLAVGLFLQAVLRGRLAHAELAALAPLCTGGVYYSLVTTRGLSQIEAFPGLFLTVACWLAAPHRDSEAPGVGRSVAAGAVAATAVGFHGHMWPVVVVVLGLAAAFAGGWRRLGWMFGGALLFAGTAVAIFAAQGSLAGVAEVYLTYPRAAAQEVPADVQGIARIRYPLQLFVTGHLPWIACAMAVLLQPRRALERPLLVLHAGWGLAGLAVMLLETRSSWPFHFLYFVVPLGVVAVFGLDTAAAWWEARGWQRGVGLALTIGVLALVPGAVREWRPKAGEMLRHVQHGEPGWDAFRREVSPTYAQLTPLRARLAARPGPIYVIGNPLVHTLTGRRQALALQGWAWEVYLDRHWASLPEALRKARPVFVVLQGRYRDLVQAKSPETLALLSELFEESDLGALAGGGSLFALRPDGG